MSNRLISIAGIDNKMEKILSSRSQITTLKQFYDATRTSADRAALASKTKIPLTNIAYWAVQAELLRIDTMTYDLACDLIEIGVLSVDQLKKANAKEVFEKIKQENPRSSISESLVLRLQKSTVKSAKIFEMSSIEEEMASVKKEMPSIYSDLSSVITELGKGVAQAQHELDLNSMDIQNKILQDEALYGMGLQATWYVMPEVEFSMKIDYAVSEERSESGSMQIGVAPSNATYSNLFKMSKKEESTIKLRIVPIPANEKFAVRKIMPDLIGSYTIKELKGKFDLAGISSYKICPEEAYEWDENTRVKITYQNPPKKTILKLNEIPEIEVKKL